MFKNSKNEAIFIDKLNARQMIFCTEYLKDLNGTRAYKVAYPNCKKDSTASAGASKLLTNTNIKNYIDEKLKEIESQKIMDATEVLELLTSIARGETSEEVVTSMGLVVNKKVSEKDRLKGIELMGKYYSLFTDKVDAKVDMSVVILGGAEDLEE